MKTAQLSRRCGELLLRLVEQPHPVITAAALDDLVPDARPSLVDAGALELHGAVQWVLVPGDDGPVFRDLAPLPDRDVRGYFDVADGAVAVAPDEQRVLRLSLSWWLAWLARSLDLTNFGNPTELVASRAWDIGDLWLSRQRKVPVVFARLLHREATRRALSASLRQRAGRGGGLILTSSRDPPPLVHESPSFAIMPIARVLTNDADRFAVDRELVRSPYVRADPASRTTEPLHLSPDGRLLVINGIEMTFSSRIHIAIIRLLVEAHRAGHPLRASEVLARASSAAPTFRKAFGAKRWAMLEPHLKSKGGDWAFEI